MSADNDSTAAQDDEYILGHSAHELGRLSAQAQLYTPLTLTFFRAAGIAAGMRVLDVGCGGGDVSLLIARLVGSSGEVLGIDRSAAAIATAQQRAKDLSAQNLRFLVADATSMTLDIGLATERPFDAAIGRSVLEFLSGPLAYVIVGIGICVAAISLVMGSREGLQKAIWALVGGALLFGVDTVVNFIAGNI